MATREERSRTRGRFFSSVNFLNWFPGSYDTREYQYHSMWNYMSSPMAVASIALILCVIGLCGYHSVKWIARHDIEINQYDFETKGTYPEFPTFAVSIENDLVPEYLIVRFSLVTIFNQNRSDRNVTPCGLGHPCYPLENLNATAFICPPEDCYHVEGSLASSVFSFTRIEISKNPDVDTTNLSKAIMGIRAQLYVGTSFCDYPNRVKRNCVKVVNGDIRWTGFFDPDVVLINDYNLRYINVIDTRRIALRGQHVKSIWVIQCTEEHIEVAAESPAHNNSVASLNLLLDTTTTEVYRNHENGLDFLEEIGSVFGLAGFVALVITMVNKVAWCFCHGKMVQKVCPCTKKATEENKRLLEYENLFSDPKGKRFCCTGSISLRTMNNLADVCKIHWKCFEIVTPQNCTFAVRCLCPGEPRVTPHLPEEALSNAPHKRCELKAVYLTQQQADDLLFQSVNYSYNESDIQINGDIEMQNCVSSNQAKE